MFIDSHCHLDYFSLKEDLEGVIARARSAGVDGILSISTRISCFEELRHIAESYERVWCSVGTHPHNALEESNITPDEILFLSKHSKNIAIGETGLDYYREENPPADVQIRVFLNHIQAARATGLPLVIHSRAADDDMARILEEEIKKGAFPFVLHCFSSGKALAEKAIDLGGYISFSGILTYTKSSDVREIAAELPINRILLETDAPYLVPRAIAGKSPRYNEPSFITQTASVLAKIINKTDKETGMITSDNFFQLFRKAERILY